MGDNRLTGRYVNHSVEIFHTKRPLQNNCEFIEFRRLSGLLPASRTMHSGDAGEIGSRIDPSDVFVNLLWLVSGGCNACGLTDEGWHPLFSFSKNTCDEAPNTFILTFSLKVLV
jgi:hypothetical protein